MGAESYSPDLKCFEESNAGFCQPAEVDWWGYNEINSIQIFNCQEYFSLNILDDLPPLQENLPGGQTPGPDQPDWQVNAEKAASQKEALAILTNAATSNSPGVDMDLQAQNLLRQLQKEDPHLTYLAENGLVYQILIRENTPLEVRKNRRTVRHTSENWSPLLRLSYLGLSLAVLGLLLAGLGTLVCAPIAIVAALVANLRTRSREGSVHSLALVMLASGIWLIGLLLSVIFLLHMI